MLWHQLVACAILGLALTQLQLASSQQSNGVVANNSSCPTNFTEVGDKCLLAVTTWFNWYEADRNCRSKGANLLSLQNDAQLQLINKWLIATEPYAGQLWTSGNTLGAQKGVYFWQSTGEQARYLPWATGQPSPTKGDTLILTGVFGSTSYSNYRLANQNSSDWAGSICEQKLQKYNTRICLKPEAVEMTQVPAK